jgi:hypothetical protein
VWILGSNGRVIFFGLIDENAVATYDVVNKSHQSGKKAILKH